MTRQELLARADRIQKSRPFKIGATVAILIVAILVFTVYALQRGLEATESTLGGNPPAVGASAPDAGGPSSQASGTGASGGGASTASTPGGAASGTTPDTAGAARSAGVPSSAQQSAVQVTGHAMQRILAGREDLTSLAVGIGVVAGLTIVVIWLGFFLTHLAIGVVVVGVATPLTQWPPTAAYGWVLLGVASLAWAFNVGLALLRTVFSAPSPVFAVARNVLDEAVRLKLSLLFIVLLMFLMATLPMLLDSNTPLRYRVQAFLQYSTGGAFWLIAMLTLLFGVSTVTLEQRDKIIWQTMTKPVAPWQYLLGKWLGVVGLNAILLGVCCSGVFLFTEYLRSTPALGEQSAYVPQNRTERITEDRLILETQILQARVSVQPPPDFDKDNADFQAAVREYVESIKANDPMFAEAETQEQQRRVLDNMFARVLDDLYTSETQRLRSIAPGGNRVFEFRGLDAARRTDQPLLLRYKIDAGSNLPDESYKITFRVGSGENVYGIVEECSLGFTHAVPIAPAILISELGYGITPDNSDFARAEEALAANQIVGRYLESSDLVDPNGVLRIEVWNYDAENMRPNPDTLSFPAGGLEVTYSEGSYRMNFVRVAAVLWVKLAFLAMLAIFASTFLSFPVACLVALGTFLAAESSGFLSVALQSFTLNDRQNNPIVANHVIYWIASGITETFRVYRDLDPIGKIVDGRLLPWSSVATGVGVLGGLTAILYMFGVLIFRRRELATYSGQ